MKQIKRGNRIIIYVTTTRDQSQTHIRTHTMQHKIENGAAAAAAEERSKIVITNRTQSNA